MDIDTLLATHPDVRGHLDPALARCIEECLHCAVRCTACADACLAEDHVAELRQCIRLDLDCADLCALGARLGVRRTGGNEETLCRALEACATACRLCGDECDRHASMHEHCRLCAEACHRCEQACRAAVAGIGA